MAELGILEPGLNRTSIESDCEVFGVRGADIAGRVYDACLRYEHVLERGG